MKVALILPSNIEYLPYVQCYIDILASQNIAYDIVGWNREKQIDYGKPNYHCYNRKSDVLRPAYKKLVDYYLFSRFVIKRLKSVRYDFVIVYTIANAIFLSNYLKKHFKERFIFDIRDYSPTMKFFQSIVSDLVKCSAINCTSSKGFYSWLPDGKYIISHNVRSYLLNKTYQIVPIDRNNVRILTIGTLRDFNTNARLLHDFGNKRDFSLIFAGNGYSKVPLEEYAYKNSIKNVCFTGSYDKEDEPQIVSDSDFVNIVLPLDLIGTYLMSNRFYLSIVHRKPMIVNAGSFQAKYVKKYNLGVIVEPDEDIYKKIVDFIASFDPVNFNDGCEACIKEIQKDLFLFESSVANVLCRH